MFQRSMAFEIVRLMQKSGANCPLFLVLPCSLDLAQSIANREAGRFLPRWELLEGFDEIPDDGSRRQEQIGAPEIPVLVTPGCALHRGLLERIGMKVRQSRGPPILELLAPDIEAGCILLVEHHFPLAIAQRGVIAVIRDVVDLLAFTWRFTFQQGKMVVPVEMHLDQRDIAKRCGQGCALGASAPG